MDNWLYDKVLEDQEQQTGRPNGLQNTSMKIMFQTIQDAIEGKIGPAKQAAPVAPVPDRPDGLLPCPFCGSDKLMDGPIASGIKVYKFCLTCGAAGPGSCGPERGPRITGEWGWNLRAGASQ